MFPRPPKLLFARSLLCFHQRALPSFKSRLISPFTRITSPSVRHHQPISIMVNQSHSFAANSASPTPTELVGSKIASDLNTNSTNHNEPPLSPDITPESLLTQWETFKDSLAKAGVDVTDANLDIDEVLLELDRSRKRQITNFDVCTLNDIDACTGFIEGHDPIRIEINNLYAGMDNWQPPEYMVEMVRAFCDTNGNGNEVGIRPLIDILLIAIIDWYNSTRVSSRRITINREMSVTCRGDSVGLTGKVDYALGWIDDLTSLSSKNRDRSFINITKSRKPSPGEDTNPIPQAIAPACCVAANTRRNCYAMLTDGNYWTLFKSQYSSRKVHRLNFKGQYMITDRIGPILQNDALLLENLKLLFAMFEMVLDDMDKESQRSKTS